MTKMDEFTLSLITNDEVIGVDQDSSGNHQLFSHDGFVAWIADVPNSMEKYLAVFNTRDKPAPPSEVPDNAKLPVAPAAARIPVPLADLGFTGSCHVRDLWQKKGIGEFTGEFAPEINWHGAGLYRVSPGKKSS